MYEMFKNNIQRHLIKPAKDKNSHKFEKLAVLNNLFLPCPKYHTSPKKTMQYANVKCTDRKPYSIVSFFLPLNTIRHQERLMQCSMCEVWIVQKTSFL